MNDKPSKLELLKGFAILAVIVAIVTIINNLITKAFWAFAFKLLDKLFPAQ